MNKAVTSREELILAAKEIVFQEGADKLSIRSLARHCKIAVGSVYNYFPSKAELLLGVVEEFWRVVFHSDLCQMPQFESFPDFMDLIYSRLCAHLNEFKNVFLGQFQLLKEEEKTKAREVEDGYMVHIQGAYVTALEQDAKIRDEIWDQTFTKEKFGRFVFTSMLQMITTGEKDCDFLKAMVCRIIYKEEFIGGNADAGSDGNII